MKNIALAILAVGTDISITLLEINKTEIPEETKSLHLMIWLFAVVLVFVLKPTVTIYKKD